jgi:hypothetical protein
VGSSCSGRYHHPANYFGFVIFIKRICLRILGQLRETVIDFAFPSQTVYAAGDDKRLIDNDAHRSEKDIDDDT